MFATNMLLARYTADFIPPVALAVWRWLGVCVLLLPFCGGELWRQRRAVLRDVPKLLVLGGLGMGICGALVYAAGKTTTAHNRTEEQTSELQAPMRHPSCVLCLKKQ